MTAQIPDQIIYGEREYDLVFVQGDNLVVPEDFDLEPAMISTACWRGFYAVYKERGQKLYLHQMTVRTEREEYPPIEGVEAGLNEERGLAVYDSLGLFVPFTGEMLIGCDFIQEKYVHMGFQEPSAYREVRYLRWKEGLLVEEKDCSQEVEKVLEKLEKSPGERG